MGIYFFETDDTEKNYLRKHLPGEMLHFSAEPLTTAAQARSIARDADIVSVCAGHIGEHVMRIAIGSHNNRVAQYRSVQARGASHQHGARRAGGYGSTDQRPGSGHFAGRRTGRSGRGGSVFGRKAASSQPDIAFDSAEAVERILDTTIANIKAFRSGYPQNQVHT